jgi:hypothetical protein
VSDLIGRSFVVFHAQDRWFPKQFTVIAELHGMIQLENADGTYWVSRSRFDQAEGTVFREVVPVKRNKNKATAAEVTSGN